MGINNDAMTNIYRFLVKLENPQNNPVTSE